MTPKTRDDELVEFDRRLKQLGHHAPVTVALVAVNVVIWLMMITSGADWLDPNAWLDPKPDTLRAWGANYAPLTTHGHGWRLLTSLFVHAGIVQLLVNQWALYQLGSWLERFFGHIGFALLYLLAGFAGNMLGVRWRPDSVLAGSTSAICGLIGALAAFYWRSPGTVPSVALGRLRAGAFVFLAYNVGIELYRGRLDSGGFFGGLVAGFLAGLVLSQPMVAGEPLVRWWRNALVAAVGVVVAILAAIFVLRPPPPNVPKEISGWYDLRQQAIETYSKAGDDFKADKIAAQEFVRIVEEKILPDWRRKEAHLKQLDLSKLTPFAAEQIKAIGESMELRRQAFALVADAVRQGDEDAFGAAAKKAAEAQDIEDRVVGALERQQKASERKGGR